MGSWVHQLINHQPCARLHARLRARTHANACMHAPTIQLAIVRTHVGSVSCAHPIIARRPVYYPPTRPSIRRANQVTGLMNVFGYLLLVIMAYVLIRLFLL